MQYTDIFSLGTSYQYLRLACTEGNYPIKGNGYLEDNLNRLINKATELGLNKRIINELTKIQDILSQYKEGDRLSKDVGGKLFDIIETIRIPIQIELENMLIFESIKECILDKSCLIKLMNKENNSFFEMWDNMNYLSKSDFSDAAKCLLLGASTPAVMISLRATEEIVREYYKIKTGKPVHGEVWGRLTKTLEKKGDVNKDLISHLDYIRKTKRNFAQHPGKLFTQREAERIFIEVISAVHEMYNDMSILNN